MRTGRNYAVDILLGPVRLHPNWSRVIVGGLDIQI